MARKREISDKQKQALAYIDGLRKRERARVGNAEYDRTLAIINSLPPASAETQRVSAVLSVAAMELLAVRPARPDLSSTVDDTIGMLIWYIGLFNTMDRFPNTPEGD